jgi:hypothetical protein
MMRTSPIAARIITVAPKKCIGNGTPFREPRGLLKAVTTSTISTNATPAATASAAPLIGFVHGDTARTAVSAVSTE